MNDQENDHRQPGAPTPDAAIRDFTFTEINGVKVLKEPSNSTATIIRYDGPALELELRQAMTYSQRSGKRLGYSDKPIVLGQMFPTIGKYCDDDQIKAIACSDPGKINPRKQAVHIISERLQMPPATVERYFRKPTVRKT